MRDQSRILVTALFFEQASPDEIEKFSARTFIEINTNQTKVTTLHLEGIAFEILGKTDNRSLAAHVLRILNERQNKIKGVLKTSDSPTGVVKVTEIVGALARITNLPKIAELAAASRTAETVGYELLLGASLAELKKPKTLIQCATICAERYFNLVGKIFPFDFPTPGHAQKDTAFELTKMFAALMLLLQQFLSEGLNWSDVENELKKILNNVKHLRHVKHYKGVLLKRSDSRIPTARHRI